MAITMKDVAARAGVSPTVVSRVLHGKAMAIRVSEATSVRVRQAAEDLGYQCNAIGRNLRERRTNVIGILHGFGFGRPKFNAGPRYFAVLMDGIVEGAFDLGYSLTLCPQLYGQTPAAAMADGRFDGLIWYSTHTSEIERLQLERAGVPLALIHTPSAQFGHRFPSTRCDNVQGINLAVDHLVELGHRKIGFALETDDYFGEIKMRLEAFFDRMAFHGLSADASDLVDIQVDRTGLDRYYRNGPTHTAVIAANDGVAGSFIDRAEQFGIDIPGQFSVIGFDSTDYCLSLRPQLTSIAQPLDELGRTAVRLLVDSIQGASLVPPDVILPCVLDIRQSTGPVR